MLIEVAMSDNRRAVMTFTSDEHDTSHAYRESPDGCSCSPQQQLALVEFRVTGGEKR